MKREEAIEILSRPFYMARVPRDILEAHGTAIEALKRESKWISVKERLPEPDRLVLCYITTGITETYFTAFWNDLEDDWEEGIGGCRLLERDLGYKVIAWQSLPTPCTERDD